MPSALHQLRPIPAEFTGRIAEINKLIANVRAGASAVTSISSVKGMPGIGKTELANIAGYALLKDYPDAQLFIELKANSPAPLTPVQALTRCLTAFYPAAKLPDDETSLHNLYLSALQGKRTLVILDDARDDTHVAPLLPPAGCGAVITSRHALRTGIPLPLDMLPRAESIKLLCSFTERVGEYADALAGLCGDLPIALTVAGGYLKVYESKPVQEYIQALQCFDRVQRLQVDTLFDYSYRTLTLPQQTAFQSLAVMPANFDRPAALAVIGAGDTGADEVDELVALNLFQYDVKAQRYRWHDLLRDFARSHATIQALDAAADRHSAYYLTVLSHADDLYLAGNASISLGLALYDQESSHIRAGQAWAASHASEEAAAERCIDYANAGAHVLDLRLHPREHIRWLETQLAAARKIHRKRDEGYALGNLGLAYANLGNASKAIDFYEQALVIDREIGDRQGEGQDLGNLGIAYADLGDAHKAIEYHEHALAIAREIGNRQGEGNTLGNLGIAYANLGDAHKAIDFYEQALIIHREIGDRQSEALGLDNLGNAYIILRDTYQAIELCGQALVILHQIGDRYNEAIASWDLGLAYEKQADLACAIPLMQARIDYEREIGHPDAEKHAKHVDKLQAKLAEKGND